jgi:hypothetical protein
VVGFHTRTLGGFKPGVMWARKRGQEICLF